VLAFISEDEFRGDIVLSCDFAIKDGPDPPSSPIFGVLVISFVIGSFMVSFCISFSIVTPSSYSIESLLSKVEYDFIKFINSEFMIN